MQANHYELITIGASAGGISALTSIFSNLHRDFSIPIVVIQHIKEFSENYLVTHLNLNSKINVNEAADKMSIEEKTAYVAPPSYHLLVEHNKQFSLSEDSRVSYARPSIDVFFESAAEAYNKSLVGVLLTGANSDGSNGLKKIQDYGGYTIVQSPSSCVSEEMPKSALALITPNQVLSLLEISELLNMFDETKGGVGL